MWIVKMLKLLYVQSSSRPSVFSSLATGYTHILTRSFSTRPPVPVLQKSSLVTSASPGPNESFVFSNYGGVQAAVSANNREQVDVIRTPRPMPLPEIARQAELWLGSDLFSAKNSLSYNFGTFNDIITLFGFKMAHVDHPLLYLTNILEAEYRATPESGLDNPYTLWRAMMVLLATDMFGYTNQMKEAPEEVRNATLDRHTRVSKIVEITYITQQIHKRILDIQESQSPSSSLTKAEHKKFIEDMHKGNKAGTLIGDLLWTQKCVHMAALKCQPVTGLICGFLMDYCESEFVFGVNSVRPEHFSYKSWAEKTQLGIGSLMGNTMSAMLLFSGYDDRMRKIGYQLGMLLGLTYQAYDDIKFFDRAELGAPNWIDVGLLPIVYKIQQDPNLLHQSFPEIFDKVKRDDGLMTKSKETLEALQEETLEYLAQLDPYVTSTQSRDILQRFVESLCV